ncbi:MAG: hypothetical protein II085_00025 [Alphaproteobacteria bacterium]|nr:hypothetical protein [Alphaproteobacteria bacterium]
MQDLTEILSHYGVKGEVTGINVGPMVQQIEFLPEAGTKIKSITASLSDIAREMGVSSLRVEPIAGTSKLGFEIPAEKMQTVDFVKIIESEEFQSVKGDLPICLGVDIAGRPVYADLAKMLYDVTERKILFDTAGWNLNDKNTQKRMEDLVQKVVSTNDYDFIKFYISVNPFHSIYNKSVELFEQKDYENAKRLREIYTDRMANVIFTFSPLIGKTNSADKTPQLEFLFRALFNETELEGYQRWNLEMLRNEIYDKLEKLYLDDLKSGNPKVVKSEEQLKEYQDYFDENFLYKHIDLVNICNEKLINKLKLNDVSAGEQEIAEKYTFKSANVGKDFQYGKIDLNGKFYMTNYIETYPTDIVLNYENKEKQTAPIKPNLREDEVITKEMIEKI